MLPKTLLQPLNRQIQGYILIFSSYFHLLSLQISPREFYKLHRERSLIFSYLQLFSAIIFLRFLAKSLSIRCAVDGSNVEELRLNCAVWFGSICISHSGNSNFRHDIRGSHSSRRSVKSTTLFIVNLLSAGGL